MIIDAHQHVFWHGRDDGGLVADMDGQGIDLAWLLTWEVPVTENPTGYPTAFNPVNIRADGTFTGIPFSDLLKAKEHYPDRFVLGYCPDAIVDTAAEQFESAYNMHGVRICGEWKLRMLLDDPRSLRLFHKAGELLCPVVIHIDVPYLPDAETGEPVYQREWYGGTVENFERALQACPETTFLGHGPGFWREISGDAPVRPETYPDGSLVPGGKLDGLFAANPNLCADLSANSALTALGRDLDYTRDFLSRYADRILFGRDYYGGRLNEFLGKLDLRADVREKGYCENARRLVCTD